MFTECVVEDSNVQYFGDVDGVIGETFGLTQNGSFVLRSNFTVLDPRDIDGCACVAYSGGSFQCQQQSFLCRWHNFSFRSSATGGETYTFSWIGSFTQQASFQILAIGPRVASINTHFFFYIHHYFSGGQQQCSRQPHRRFFHTVHWRFETRIRERIVVCLRGLASWRQPNLFARFSW